MFVAQNTITVEFLPAPQEFRSQGAGRHSRSNGSLTIKIFVNQVHKNLCIRVTAERGNVTEDAPRRAAAPAAERPGPAFPRGAWERENEVQ